MIRKQAPDPGSPIADLQKAAKSAAENGSFDEGLDRLARKPDDEKPAFGEGKRKRTPEEQRAEIERVAREHGVDLSEEAFNEVLRKMSGTPKRA